jgi:hypothetical protein
MKYVATCVLCLMLFACGKDEPKEPTKTELLTSATWKYDNGGVDANHDGTIDVNFSAGVLPACTLDNVATFSSNNTGVADEGATKCTTTAPQSSPFTWSFNSNETAINLAGSGLFGIGGQFNIIALSSTQFSLSKDTTYMSLPVTMIVHLKH